MHELLKIFWLGGENHNQKTSKSGGFFQKITAAHQPEAACSLVAFEHKKGVEFSENLQIFFGMHKFLKIFSLGGENHSQKTSKSGGFFSWKSLPWKGIPEGTMKSQKNYKIFKKSQDFFKKHKFLKFFFGPCRIANGFLRPGASGRCKSQPENQQIWWSFSSKSLPLARNPIR